MAEQRRAVDARILRRAIEAVSDIAMSPMVGKYIVGMTKHSLTKRLGPYRSIGGYNNIISIVDCLDSESALDVEQHIFAKIHSDKLSMLYKKYAVWGRDKPYRRNSGGQPPSAELVHKVYVVWAANTDM